VTFTNQESEQGLSGRDFPGTGRIRVAKVVQMQHVVGDDLVIDTGPIVYAAVSLFEEPDELAQIVAVRGQRVGRNASLDGHEMKEVVYTFVQRLPSFRSSLMRNDSFAWPVSPEYA
jgi:hypothetical protein